MPVHVDDQRTSGIGGVIGRSCPGGVPRRGLVLRAPAVSIAINTAAASAARWSTVGDTIGCEATEPDNAGSAHSNAISERQPPPTARASAKSSRTFVGSWTARRGRHGCNTVDGARSRLTLAIVSVGSQVPAYDTTVVAAVSRSGHG